MSNPSRRANWWMAAIAALAICSAAFAQDRLAQDLAKYNAEPDPVRRTRDLVKLGDAQVDVARKQLKDGDTVASLATLQQYRDEVLKTSSDLAAMGVDAEKRPSGFKELQISLRETIRKIDDMIFTLSVDDRPPFRDVRADLAQVQNNLMDALFPRNGDHPPKKSAR
jgi:hypothetical protein